MHARLTTLSVDDIDRATKVFVEEVLPEARKLAGFQGAVSFADRSSGQVRSFTLWESEETLNASVEAANRLRSDAVKKIGVKGTPTVEQFEVVVWETK